jgi:hypothetical protein
MEDGMKIDAQRALEAIYERDGALNPEAVVEIAAEPTSPLHRYFDWDNEKAGNQHRLNQARNLIRVAVKVLPQVSNQPVRQFVSLSTLRGTGTGSYLATVDIVDDADRYEIAKIDAIRALQQFQRRFSYIRELEVVWDALATLTAELEESTRAA